MWVKVSAITLAYVCCVKLGFHIKCKSLASLPIWLSTNDLTESHNKPSITNFEHTLHTIWIMQICSLILEDQNEYINIVTFFIQSRWSKSKLSKVKWTTVPNESLTFRWYSILKTWFIYSSLNISESINRSLILLSWHLFQHTHERNISWALEISEIINMLMGLIRG